jgi:hypothetical protein
LNVNGSHRRAGNDCSRDEQPQPEVVPRIIGLTWGEWLKNRRLHRRWDWGTAIVDAEDDALGRTMHFERDRASTCILNGVAQQVRHDLRKSVRIPFTTFPLTTKWSSQGLVDTR